MAKDEIVEGIIRLLRDHASGLRGTIDQEPYTHDFFRLFAKAYNAGMMSGSDNVLYADALTSIIAARAPELVEGPVWESLRQFWRDWTYAWNHAAELERRSDSEQIVTPVGMTH